MSEDVDEPTATDDLRRWLGDDDARSPSTPEAPHTTRPASRRRAWWALLVAVAAVPWALVALMPPSGTRPPGADVPPEVGRSEPASRGGGASAAAGPVAVRLVRDAVTSTGPGTATALDAAAAEQPDPVAHDTWIVRVHAVVLRGDRRRWRSATHEIWAVPIGRRDGAIVGLDVPWRVATDARHIADATWEPVDADVTEVRAALRRAGLPAAAEVRTERDPRRAAVLRAVIGAGSRRRHVWLRTTPTMEVLGHETTTPDGS